MMAKRKRATKKDMQERYDAILNFAREQEPVTVRGIFYHLTTVDLMPKDDKGYDSVAGYCKNLRKSGAMPFEWIADNTRWVTKQRAYSGVDAFLENSVQTYRRDLMIDTGVDIEIWLEKDALSGVIAPITQLYDVPLYVSRGYSSMSFLYNAAKQLQDGAFVYIFTDCDAAGKGIADDISNKLSDYIKPGKEITISREMLTHEQVSDWDVATRKPKPKDINEGYDFCAELDAVPPNKLRAEIERCILNHVSVSQLESLRTVEEAERESIKMFAKGFTELQLTQ